MSLWVSMSFEQECYQNLFFIHGQLCACALTECFIDHIEEDNLASATVMYTL